MQMGSSKYLFYFAFYQLVNDLCDKMQLCIWKPSVCSFPLLIQSLTVIVFSLCVAQCDLFVRGVSSQISDLSHS